MTSYFTKYTLSTGGAMSLHLLVPVGVEQGCVGCAQCAGGAGCTLHTVQGVQIVQAVRGGQMSTAGCCQ